MAWLDGHLTGPEVAASVVFTVYLAARVSLIGVAATSRARLQRIYALPGRLMASIRRMPVARARHRSGRRALRRACHRAS